MRATLFAVLVVFLGLVLPIVTGSGLLYVECLWDLRVWVAWTAALQFVGCKWAVRRLMQVVMRVPGSRLKAGRQS